MTGSPARAPHRTPSTGSAFIRALAALNGAPAPASPGDFAQRVSQWLDWTQAFALSAALSDAAAPAPASARSTATALDALARDHIHVRSALAKLAAEAPTGPARERGLPSDPAPDITTYRRRYAACQQAMETQIAPLRRRARAALTDASPAMAQLAALDAVMEPVVGVLERALLSTVTSLLERRFDHLRQHGAGAPHRAADTASAPADPAQPGPWLDTFHHEMRTLLLAELDLRLQPVEGLLAAGRAPSSDRHE